MIELEKNNYINRLLQFYEVLLTKKQKEYISLYYGEDYSLGEISEEFSVSRQAVYDNIKRTVKLIEGYEDKLHLLRDFDRRNAKLDKINEYVKSNYANDQTLQSMLSKLTIIEEE